jgi:nicotinamidase-related amidase
MTGIESFGDTVRRDAGLAESLPAIDPGIAALMIIDVTNFDSHPEHGFARFAREEGLGLGYYWDRVENLMMPNLCRLLERFRAVRGRIVHVRVGAQFEDYADSQRNFREVHRRSGSLRGTEEFEIREALAPRVGEAVVDKPGASAFTTGNADILLRNAGVDQLVVTGVVTNGCVISSAISAWDLGYQVLVVEDACVGGDAEQHAAAITVMNSMGMTICSTDELLERLTALTGAVSAR